MKSIKEILLELVSVQSDSGTKLECNMADKLIELIKENSYFQEYKENFGIYVDKDILERPVVWALRKGKTKKTIILMGHYDAVEIDSYGVLKDYALTPDRLKTEMKNIKTLDKELKDDLNNDNWMFGRGVADMKAGVAINLYTLFTNVNEDVNILFIAVPDEENMSSGAREAIKLYEKLMDKFGLEYKMCIISEPCFRNVDRDEPITITCGSTGKILPVIVAKGKLAHAARVMNGINSCIILSDIIRKVEFNTDFISEDMGFSTQPPTVQIFRDLKNCYDVSIPEYSAACFNVLFLKSKNPNEIMESIKEICRESLDDVRDKYNKTFDILLGKGTVTEDVKVNFNGKVMDLHELEDYVSKTKGNFEDFKQKIRSEIYNKIHSEKMTLPDASIFYMKRLIEFSEISHPLIVIGIAPPYYPPTNVNYVSDEISGYINKLPLHLRNNCEIRVRSIPYTAGMTDMSYMSNDNSKQERKFLDNLTLPSDMYDIDFETLEKLNIPTVMIGPASKYVHQIGERVYLPDVIKTVPDIFYEIINTI